MKRIAIACTALLVASIPARAQFLDLGRIINKAVDVTQKTVEANREFTPEEEVALGQGIAAGILGAAPLDPDANLQRYVNRVGKWLAMNSERPDLPWTFGVIEGDAVNAFALPGGTVFVSRGLVNRLSSESELAGVLGHEIAHVLLKHQLKAIQSAQASEVWTDLAKEGASEAIGRRGGNVLGQELKSYGAKIGLEALKNGVFLRPLDRSMEYEADRLGMVVAARGGYDPYGLVAALQMLEQLKPDETGASIMFSTHPAPADRIAELEKFAPELDRYAGHPEVRARFRKVVGAAP